MQSIPSSGWEWLAQVEPGDRFALAVVISTLTIIAAVIIVGVLAWMARSIHHHRLDDALKRELLDRGMGAEEVALVISANSAKGPRQI